MNTEITGKLIELVKIASPSGSETSIRNYLVVWLKKNNFNWKIDKTGNLYGTRGKLGPALLFCAHMDTVNPGTNIKPVIKNKFIQSSGNTILGADNKAFIASLLHSIERYQGGRKIELLFSVKEETGGGVEFFPFNWINSKICYIFDNANPVGGIVLRSPYIINFHISIKGMAAHSSVPDNGINALIIAINLLKRIKIGSTDNKETTINIGLIKSGSGINTVPESADFSGEIRSYNKKLFLAQLDKIERLITSEKIKTQGSIKIKKDGYCPGYQINKQDTLIKQLIYILKKNSIEYRLHNYSGISDANILNSKGIKSVVLSDGVISPHTTEEKIATDSLDKMSNTISDIIYSK